MIHELVEKWESVREIKVLLLPTFLNTLLLFVCLFLHLQMFGNWNVRGESPHVFTIIKYFRNRNVQKIKMDAVLELLRNSVMNK